MPGHDPGISRRRSEIAGSSPAMTGSGTGMKHLYHPTALDPAAPIPSWWRASVTAPPTEYAPLQGDIETEVAIIGGGYTGLSAAYHLAKNHGIKPVVLERAFPGWGAS